ncbi:hypothetical protein M1271_02345 [Patescibacteria group bacterium]|nr:hypothetical protein [Patescibacteria group bacterium]
MPFDGFLKKRIVTINSNINGEIKFYSWFGKKTLYVNSVAQSGGEYVRMWNKSIDGLKKLNIEKSLVLGVGGATVIEKIRDKYPEAIITGVELDHQIIKIAQRFFRLKTDAKTKIVVSNAETWIKKSKDKDQYDLIVVDLFLTKYNPEFSRKENFLKKLKILLRENGEILYNSHFRPDSPEEFGEFEEMCRKIFSFVKVIFSYRYNRVMLFK